jgi:hypothetical protein
MQERQMLNSSAIGFVFPPYRFGKLLVLVVEPSKRTRAAYPELFGEKKQAEVRQLSVAPVLSGSLTNQRSASVQSRFTSLEPVERSSRNASLPRGSTPLFRGATPADSEVGTPAPDFATELSAALTSADDSADNESQQTIGELEGLELATQMLEREEQTSGGNDIEDGD